MSNCRISFPGWYRSSANRKFSKREWRPKSNSFATEPSAALSGNDAASAKFGAGALSDRNQNPQVASPYSRDHRRFAMPTFIMLTRLTPKRFARREGWSSSNAMP